MLTVAAAAGGRGWEAEQRRTIELCRAPPLRTITEFAEQEFVHHTGPRPGKFRRETQPFAGLILDEIALAHATHRYSTIALTGPRQTGKSVLGYSQVPLRGKEEPVLRSSRTLTTWAYRPEPGA
jgi:hypothetical protein